MRFILDEAVGEQERQIQREKSENFGGEKGEFFGWQNTYIFSSVVLLGGKGEKR